MNCIYIVLNKNQRQQFFIPLAKLKSFFSINYILSNARKCSIIKNLSLCGNISTYINEEIVFQMLYYKNP